MNILFVNHNDFLSNSMGHLAGFANVLSAQGHSCIAAVPFGRETARQLTRSLFIPASFDDVLSGRVGFPDGRRADIVHAWTPRENVRKFVARYQPAGAMRLVIHLEDNEELLLERWANTPFEDLAALADEKLAPHLTEALSHPRHYRTFLRTASAATVITGALADFVPAPVPSTLLRQGLDLAAFHPGPAEIMPAVRSALAPGDRILAYPGNLHHANGPDVRALLLAVQLLNSRGYPCKLVRTGAPAPEVIAALAPDAARFVIDLGFLPREMIPVVLRMADVLVQPGEVDRFNIYRLPSKIPEFLGVGRPVIMPACNIAQEMVDGEDALLLRIGSPAEIADFCIRVFEDKALADRLGQAGAAFARRFFDPVVNASKLDGLYRDLMDVPLRTIRRDSVLASLADLLVGNSEDGLPTEDLQAEIARELRLSSITPAAGETSDDPSCRCYEPVAGGYREDRSTTRTFIAERWQRIRFDCDCTVPTGRIRIDPAEGPCLFDIASVTIRSAMDEATILWRARGAELSRVQIGGTAQCLSQGRVLQGFGFGDDPQILLPSFEALAIDGPIRVDLWLRVSFDLSSVAQRLGHLDRLEDQVRKLEASLSWRVTSPLRRVSRRLRVLRRPRLADPDE